MELRNYDSFNVLNKRTKETIYIISTKYLLLKNLILAQNMKKFVVLDLFTQR